MIKIIMLTTIQWLMSNKNLADIFNRDNNIEQSRFEQKQTKSGINYLKQV